MIEPLSGEDYILTIVVAALVAVWIIWKVWLGRWWILKFHCAQGKHEWVKPQYFHRRGPDDIMAELGAAVLGVVNFADRVCEWCGTNKVALHPRADRILQVRGDWGQALSAEALAPWWEPVPELASDEIAWLDRVGVEW